MLIVLIIKYNIMHVYGGFGVLGLPLSYAREKVT